MNKILYNKYSNERAIQFNIRTQISEDGDGKRIVSKIAVGRESMSHVQNMYNYYEKLHKKYQDAGINMAQCTLSGDCADFEFIKGKNISTILDELIEEDRFEEIKEIFKRYIAFVRSQETQAAFEADDTFKKVFGDVSFFDNKKIGIQKPANIDLIFENIIADNDKWTIIDYEWILDMEVPSDFIIYRTIFYTLYNSPLRPKFEQMNLYEMAGISQEELPVFEQMEQSFQKYVTGDTVAVARYYQNGIDVKKLVAEKIWKEKEVSFQIYRDMGQGMSEQESEWVDVSLDDERNFYLEIPVEEGTKSLRLDPSDTQIILNVAESNIEIKATNGEYIDENTICFKSEDPWIIVSEECLKNNGILHIKGKAEKLFLPSVTTLNKYSSDIEGLRENKASLEASNASLAGVRDALIRENDRLNQQINNILNSTSWKVTKPLRKIKSLIKGGSEIDIARPDVAVHVHLFYTDLLDEFLTYFSNIPKAFDLYISCVKGADVKNIRKRAEKLENVRNVTVRIFKNQGRDIAPFYVGFGDELKNYKYLLHVHSKKSKHIEAGGTEWRQYSLNSLVGSRELVRKIFNIFDSEENVGLVYPECHPDIPMIGYTWMANKYQGKELLSSLGIPFREGVFNYPAGSFFWVRTDAIRPLFDRHFALEDFPEEAGQIDGTLAHVLERAIAFVSESRGYHSRIIDLEEDAVRCDVSLKPYREYLKMTLDDAKKRLMEFDTVSFDLFDTLVEFIPDNMSDIALLIRDKFGFNDDFVNYRIEAERQARAIKGMALTIDDIYNVLTQISPFDAGAANQIKEAEVALLLANIRAREDIKELYRYLIEQGKEISIVADTYYSKSTVEAAAIKCGFIGFSKIWVSSEEGISKEDEQIWNLVFAKYDMQKHIHVGSNVYADWYTLERRAAKSMWIMSSNEAYRLAKECKKGTDLKRSLFNSAFGLGDKLL